MILWDGEGGDDTIKYVGDPRLIPRMNPAFDQIADAYFKKFTDAGLRCGLTLRYSKLIFDDNGKPVQTTDPDPINNFIDKINYAYNRWGCTVYYVDSLPPWNPVVIDAVQKHFPTMLLIPEAGDTAYTAFSAPYFDGRSGHLATTAYNKNFYPDSFSVISVADLAVGPVADKIVAGVKQGDIYLAGGNINDLGPVVASAGVDLTHHTYVGNNYVAP
jgi:hypothetical protein